jgi:hypothetical protein
MLSATGRWAMVRRLRGGITLQTLAAVAVIRLVDDVRK